MAGCKYCEGRKHWAFSCNVRVPDGEYSSKDVTVPVRVCPYCGRELSNKTPIYGKGERVRVNLGLLVQIGWLPNGFNQQDRLGRTWFKVIDSRLDDGVYLYKLEDFPEGGWIPENCIYTI